MRLKNFDLIVVVAFALMNVVWVLLPNRPLLVSVVLALPLVFFLPGYVLAEVLFYKQLPNDNIHRYGFVLSLGLSIVIDILSGFFLNLFPSGLQTLSWALCLCIVTIVFSFLTVYRRRGISIGEVRRISFHFFIRRSILVGLLFIVTTVIVFSSIKYSATSVTQQKRPGFTQFWMLSSNKVSDRCTLFIGVQSFETTLVRYNIVVTANGTTISSWTTIALAPKNQWHQSIDIKKENASNIYIEAKLYRTDKIGITYRSVHINLNSRKKSNGRVLIC